MSNIQTEAFEVGFAFARFIRGCQDGRDLARFFGRDGLPDWAKSCEWAYTNATDSLTPLDTGIVIAKEILMERCSNL